MKQKTRRVVSGDEDASRRPRLVDFLGREEKDEADVTAMMRRRVEKHWRRFILLLVIIVEEMIYYYGVV